MPRTASAGTVGTHRKQVDFWAILLPPAAPSSPCNAPSTRYPLNPSSTRQPGERGHIPPCSMCAEQTAVLPSRRRSTGQKDGAGERCVPPESPRLGKVFSSATIVPHPPPGSSLSPTARGSLMMILHTDLEPHCGGHLSFAKSPSPSGADVPGRVDETQKGDQVGQGRVASAVGRAERCSQKDTRVKSESREGGGRAGGAGGGPGPAPGPQGAQPG